MRNTLRSCFHSQRVNLTQQSETYIARGFSVIFMVITHVYESFSSYNNHFARILYLDFCGGPYAAAVFMFCMGMNICYSRQSNPKAFLIRSCNLLCAGLFLSVYRDLLPALLFCSKDPTFSFKNDLIPLLLHTFAEVDILQFAGIFFMVFAIITKANFSLLQTNILAIILCISGQFLRNISTGNAYCDAFLGLFWAAHNRTWFPFFNWFIVPIAGYTFGSLWVYCCNKDAFYRIVTPIATILSVGFFIISRGYQHLDYYYVLGIIEAVFAILTALSVIGLSYFVSQYMKQVALNLCWLGKMVTPIYLIHWALISSISPVVFLLTEKANLTIPDVWIAPIGIIILLASSVLIKAYNSTISK